MKFESNKHTDFFTQHYGISIDALAERFLPTLIARGMVTETIGGITLADNFNERKSRMTALAAFDACCPDVPLPLGLVHFMGLRPMLDYHGEWDVDNEVFGCPECGNRMAVRQSDYSRIDNGEAAPEYTLQWARLYCSECGHDCTFNNN